MIATVVFKNDHCSCSVETKQLKRVGEGGVAVAPGRTLDGLYKYLKLTKQDS